MRSVRATGHKFCWRHTAACASRAGRAAARSRDLLRGTRDVANIIVEARASSSSAAQDAGRPADDRLPQAVVEELDSHIGPLGAADAHVLTSDKGGSYGPQTSGRSVAPWSESGHVKLLVAGHLGPG